MRINDRSKTDFDRAKIKLTGHFDRRPTGRYFEPWTILSVLAVHRPFYISISVVKDYLHYTRRFLVRLGKKGSV